MSTFSLDVTRWVEKAEKRHDLVVRKICLELFRGVVMMSPVGNPELWKSPPSKGYVGGRFRANWQCSIGQPASGTTSEVDPRGSKAIAGITREVSKMRFGDVIYLVNNLPYANALENGWSTQAPAGMLGVTVARFNGVVRQAAQEES